VASNVRSLDFSDILPLCVTIINIICMFINWANKDACLLSIGTSLNDLEWPLEWPFQGHDYSTSNKLKTVQHTAILTMADQFKVVYDKRRHFQWPWTTNTPVSRSRHSLTLISHKRYIVSVKYRNLHTPYSTVSFRMILSDHEWLSKIFSDTKRRAVSLRQLSFLVFSNLVH